MGSLRLPTRVAPSILSADFARLGAEIQAVEAAGADWIHVDVMDGQFVPNLTIGPPVVAALRKATKRFLDVHLMIVEPERSIEAFAEAGADGITVHAEACTHLHRVLQHIHGLGKKSGVALNPHTPASVLEHVLDEVDLVLVMTVNPGFGGQVFIAQMLPKIARIRAMLDAAGPCQGSQGRTALEVDGGINPATAPGVRSAGADTLVAGSAVFGSKDYARAIAALREERT